MPTFTIQYLQNPQFSNDPETAASRSALVKYLIEPVSQIVPATLNEVLAITDEEYKFTPDDTFVGYKPFNKQDHLATDIKFLGALPSRVAQYEVWAARAEIRQELDCRLGDLVLKSVSNKDHISSFELELIEQPSCGIARDLYSGEVLASWGGPDDIKQ